MIGALLPVGSVVRLDGAEFLAVVLGYYVDNGEQMYDYLCAPYPAGLDDPSHTIFANSDAIVEVVSHGYLDEQGEEVLKAAVEMMNAREEAFVRIGTYLEENGLLGKDDESFTME